MLELAANYLEEESARDFKGRWLAHVAYYFVFDNSHRYCHREVLDAELLSNYPQICLGSGLDLA